MLHYIKKLILSLYQLVENYKGVNLVKKLLQFSSLEFLVG